MASTRLGEILTATRNITMTLSARSNSDGGGPFDVKMVGRDFWSGSGRRL